MNMIRKLSNCLLAATVAGLMFIVAQAQTNGTPGKIAKFKSATLLGDSVITEDKFGNVGLGTALPTSKLTVQGVIESLNGFKFPDGTLQTTAGVAPTDVVKSLNGLKGDVQLAATSPITITPSGNTLTVAAPSVLTAVARDLTLTGNGTTGSPLRVAVPLELLGSTAASGGVIVATNTAPGGKGVEATGGSPGGEGVTALGGQSNDGDGGNGSGGNGMVATGGNSNFTGGTGGNGVIADGGRATKGSGGAGVRAVGGIGFGAGNSGGIGISATGGSGVNGATAGLAGKFVGAVEVNGNFNVTGGGTKNFKIDHPLDPENKYLFHAAIESSEVLNVYSGNIVTDINGDAVVSLPYWFEAINGDFRYQLTVIGSFAQAIVGQKIKGNRFRIRTNAPNVEVSWQVTGVRSDAGMLKNPFKVEADKPEGERGYYLNPDAFNQPEEKSINWARDPERMRQLKQRRLEAEQMRQSRPNQR